MISVIIPLMPIPPYDSRIIDCVYYLDKQTADLEIIVAEQTIEEHINKNALLNYGFEHSQGDYVFHCDADFTFENENLLKSMEDSGADVIYPVFRSPNCPMGYKVADGAAFVRREVLERYGPLDESGLGISLVTFPFLEWCLENYSVVISTDYVIQPQFGGARGRLHPETKAKNKPCYMRVIKKLKNRGFWI